MIPRTLMKPIQRYAGEYPVLAVVGPRQSGKTTLVQAAFPKHSYISLEDIDIRHQAQDDPRGFFQDNPPPVIFDEIQRVPDLLSYLQGIVDAHPEPGQFILTGSQQLLLLETISQTLAGRIAVFTLFPFSLTELLQRGEAQSTAELFISEQERRRDNPSVDLNELVWTGFYPRIHDRHLDPAKWLEGYIRTYVEKDVRQLINIGDLRLFENLLKVCAGMSGQLVNFTSISNVTGVSQPTVKRWLSLLESSGIVHLLPPFFENFSKRILKSPKLYFLDSGLLCRLLGIKESRQLQTHPLYGSIFETFIVSDLYKRIAHLGESSPLYFWRDRSATEVDLIVDLGTSFFPVEIKAARTFSDNFRSSIRKLIGLSRGKADRGLVIYCGQRIVGSGSQIPAVPWWSL